MDLKFRISKSKEDSIKATKQLGKEFDISPYNEEEMTKLIRSSVRIGEIQKEKRGACYYLTDLEKWFEERIKPNTVVVPIDSYKKSLYRAFKLLILGNLAKTDFGSSRQRDFGQRWTDFTRGFLGEIGTEEFFKVRFKKEVKLEEAEIGAVEKFLFTDITKIKENGKWRNVKKNSSIKTTKLQGMWLDIPAGQIGHSDVFIFIKIGLTVDHLPSFMKEAGFVESLVKMGADLGEVEDTSSEVKKLFEEIPDMKPIPIYVTGFVYQNELKEGALKIKTTPKNKIVVGGIGQYKKDIAKHIEGLGEISENKYLASTSALRWSKEDWDKLQKSL